MVRGDIVDTEAISREERLWTRDFILITLINLFTFFGFNMTSTGMPVYAASLGASDLVAGMVTSFTAGAALLIRPFTGIILGRFGRKGMLIFSIAMMGGIIVMYGIFPIVSMILFLRLCHGVAWAVSSTAVSTIAADVIPRLRFAEGMGFFALGGSLAVAIAPALAIGLVQSVGVTPLIIIAASSTALAVLLACLQRSKKVAPTGEKKRIQLADFIDVRALLPAGIMCFINCSFASVTTFIALHGKARGVSNIFIFFTVYAIVTILSRPITGKIIDRRGFFLPGILSTLAVVVTLLIISVSSHILLFCLAGVFAGLGFGTAMGTLQTMAVSAVPPQRRAVATSTFLFGLDAGIAIGALVAGALAGVLGYAHMYLVMAAFPLAACLFFLLLGKDRIASYRDI